MWQLLIGLNNLHNCGYFHRDMKPENVMIKHNGNDWRSDLIFLSDFGSSKL